MDRIETAKKIVFIILYFSITMLAVALIMVASLKLQKWASKLYDCLFGDETRKNSQVPPARRDSSGKVARLQSNFDRPGTWINDRRAFTSLSHPDNLCVANGGYHVDTGYSQVNQSDDMSGSEHESESTHGRPTHSGHVSV